MPEDRLHEQRRLDDSLVQEVGQVVEVADVVALELEPRARGAEGANDRLDVLVRVPEDEVSGHLQILGLPGVLEGADAVEDGKQPEVHAAHVQRAELRLEGARRPCALFDRHPVTPAGRDVDDGVASRLDLWQESSEDLGIGRRPARFRVACVQVDDRGSCLGRPDRALGDLFGRERKVGAL
jgi:hypothetical protein